jgi:hypothetical protein
VNRESPKLLLDFEPGLRAMGAFYCGAGNSLELLEEGTYGGQRRDASCLLMPASTVSLELGKEGGELTRTDARRGEETH